MTDREPTLQFNGSTVRFKTDGDLEIQAGRHLVGEGKLTFINFDPTYRKRATAAFSLGQEAFIRFQRLEDINNKLARVEILLGTLPEYTRNKANEHLKTVRLELLNLGQNYDLTQVEEDKKALASQNFDMRCSRIDSFLLQFMKSPFMFDDRSDQAKLVDMIQMNNPDLQVVHVEKIEEGGVQCDSESDVCDKDTVEVENLEVTIGRLQAMVEQSEEEAAGV